MITKKEKLCELLAEFFNQQKLQDEDTENQKTVFEILEVKQDLEDGIK